MPRTNRRQFLCGCSAAIAAMAGSRFNNLTFAQNAVNNETLVVLFLRGGMDGLSAFPPVAGADRGHYEAARPELQIPTNGANSVISLANGWGVHPAGAGLAEIFQDGKLALVQAAGRQKVNRSHFDSMAIMEISAPAGRSKGAGWLTRHLKSATNLPTDTQFASLAVGDISPASLTGSYETVNFLHPESFNIDAGSFESLADQKVALAELYSLNDDWLYRSGLNAFNAMRLVNDNVDPNYEPSSGVPYPNSELGDKLGAVAQMIKLDVGLQVAAIDMGAWDTHFNQGQGAGGFFAQHFGELSQGLLAFYRDLDTGGANNFLDRVTVVVMSEFGREVRENSDRGTEHGHGNTMMVMGGGAIGGLHGDFPGLHPNALEDGTDVAVTTDYRRVLSEVLIRRLANNRLGDVFPGYDNYAPLGIVEGVDLPVDYGPLFADDFESASTVAWSGREG